MYIIPEVEEGEDGVGIPVMGGGYCYIEWKEGETAEEALSRCGPYPDIKGVSAYTRFQVWSDDLSEDMDDGEADNDWGINGFNVHVYEVRCRWTGKRYYMICEREINDFEEIKDSVCVAYNKLNLMRFYVEYLCPFGRVKFRMW